MLRKQKFPIFLSKKYLVVAACTLLCSVMLSAAVYAATASNALSSIPQSVNEKAIENSARLSFVTAAEASALNSDLQIVSTLSLSPIAPITNEPTTISFAVKNIGSQTIELNKLLASGRGDGCADWSCTNYQDFRPLENLSIAPGQTVPYSQQRTLTSAGSYFAQIGYQLANGSWGFLGDRTDYSVSQNLIFDVPLTFTPAQPSSGEPIAATFTLRNAGSVPITFLNIGVGGRGPNCADWASCTFSADMPFDANITLNPGQSYTYNQQKSFWDVGTYLFRAAIKTADGWAFIGEQKSTNVTAGLVVTTPLSIVPDSVNTNEFVTVSFTVQNQSSTALTYSQIGVGGRGPNCPPSDWSCPTRADISFIESVTINPGESWHYNKRHFFPEAGSYFFQISLQETGGGWQALNETLSILVEPRVYPARSAELRLGAQYHIAFDIEQDTRLLTEARDMGIDIIHVGFLWRFLETDSKGDWDTNWYIPAVEEVLDKANELGIDVFVTFYESPCWASSDPNKDCGSESGGTYDLSYPAENHQDYADAFQKMIELFGDRVDTWEIWNEPNVERFWHPSLSMTDYVEMIKVVYPAIKEVAPDATVLAGVLAGSDVRLLEEMYAAGAKDFFDALAIHPYTSEAPDECINFNWSFLCGVEIIRATMLENNDPKPIWFSEFGWSSYDGFKGVGEATQRDYLEQSVDIMSNWDYVPVATWYTFYDRGIAFPETPHEEFFGLLDTNEQDKPAASWLRNRPKPKDLLIVSTPLTFSTNTPIQGESVTASFSIRNNGSQSITLRKIGVIVRNNGCAPHLVCTSYQDFPFDQNVTIGGGNTYTYSAQYASTQSGAHFAKVVYESSIGEWVVDGVQSTLTISVNPATTSTPTSTPTPVFVPTITPSVTPTPTVVATVTPGTAIASPTVPPRLQTDSEIFLPMLLK